MSFLIPVLNALAGLGMLGLFLVGILDSSFLFVPFGNDLLMLALSASDPAKLTFFALAATLGSTTGAAIIDAISRKGGEQGLTRILPAKRIEFVKDKVTNRAGWALAAAALLPPPFPFTPFVAAAAALQYPRWRLIAIIMSGRMLRFMLIGLLGISFGQRIVAMSKVPAVQYTLIALLVICLVGSAASVYGWIRRSRQGVEAAAA
jgi:membrane protein YqaA with SNARE-associated domain